MADSTYTPTEVARTKTSGELVGIFTVVFSAGDYVAGGLLPAVTFSQVVGFTPRKPIWVEIKGNNGYYYEFVYATQKIMIRAQTNAAAEDAPLGELAVAALPEGVTLDLVRVRVAYIATRQLMPNS